MGQWHAIQEILILLGSAMLLGGLFEHLRQNAIVGYLLAGFILGPGALKLVSNDETVRIMAEVGVALLLFTIGLEFSLKRLVSMGARAIGGGSLQIAVTTLVFAAIGLAAGLSMPHAIALGLVVAPSSTASVFRLLHDRAEIDSIHGRNAVGILLLQDLALVPMVVVMTSFGSKAGETDVVRDIGFAITFFAVLAAVFYLTSVYIVPHALSAATLVRNREIIILLATVMALGAMWMAHVMHISPALGAFVAGMLLAESPFATQIRSDVGTPRVLLVTLFFASIGMAADLPWIIRNLGLVIGSIAMVVALKAVITWGILRLFRAPSAHNLATGICLAQIGEFSFVLTEIGHGVGAIDTQLRQLMLSTAFGTLMLTPVLVASAPGIMRRLGRFSAVQADNAAGRKTLLRDHVVVVGYGPAGRSVANALAAINIPFVIVELNHATVMQARSEGLTAELGDATHEDVLLHVQAPHARAVVITTPEAGAAMNMLHAVRRLAPHVPVIVRSRYHRYMRDFADAGATFVIDEETQVGEFLGSRLASGLTRLDVREPPSEPA